MYAGKFEARLSYDAQGREVWHIITTKNYGSIDANISKNKDGVVTAKIKAEKVDATTLAAQTIEAQSGVINTLAGLVGMMPGQ